MYPYELFWGIDLYDVFLALGLFSAVVIFDLYVAKRNVPAKVQNFYLLLGGISIVAGLYGAGLLQSFFNYIRTGVFEVKGLTFYGGVIGGAAIFLFGTFVFGKAIFKEKEHLAYFNDVYEVAPCCITAAHGFGRIGCLMAGCCYGKETDGFPGLKMSVEKVVGDATARVEGYFLPTQLYEAVFLFALFALLSRLYFKRKNVNFIVYLLAYGTWRFFIEFLRADERGAFLPLLTPAQAISILAVAIGVAMIIKRIIYRRKIKA